MKRKTIIIIALVLVSALGICLWLTIPDYAHLSNEKALSHSYKEAVIYATAKDANAEVSRKAIKTNGYKIWDAEINGVKCQIASKPVAVLGRDRLGHLHSRNYHKLTDNYDYRIAEACLSKYPELGTLKTDEENMFDDTNLNSYVTGVDDYNSLNKPYKKVLQELDKKHVEHKFWVDINNGEYTLMPIDF